MDEEANVRWRMAEGCKGKTWREGWEEGMEGRMGMGWVGGGRERVRERERGEVGRDGEKGNINCCRNRICKDRKLITYSYSSLLRRLKQLRH